MNELAIRSNPSAMNYRNNSRGTSMVKWKRLAQLLSTIIETAFFVAINTPPSSHTSLTLPLSRSLYFSCSFSFTAADRSPFLSLHPSPLFSRPIYHLFSLPLILQLSSSGSIHLVEHPSLFLFSIKPPSQANL